MKTMAGSLKYATRYEMHFMDLDEFVSHFSTSRFDWRRFLGKFYPGGGSGRKVSFPTKEFVTSAVNFLSNPRYDQVPFPSLSKKTRSSYVCTPSCAFSPE